MNLDSPKSGGLIAVIGLLDLYGPQNFYPSHLLTAQERYAWGQQKLQAEVSHQKFRQFFAVHELEAWLLSDPKLFPPVVRNALTSAAANPEAVNFNQPPARLLGKLFREKLKRRYFKPVDGYDLFSKLDPEVAYQKCPRLKELLDEMLKLAKACGN